MKKIGILGSGVVAKTLGHGFLKHGYKVMLGTRDVTKLAEWQEQSKGKGKVGSFADAAKFGDVLVLAVKGAHAKEVLKAAGARRIKDKVVLDATNPIDEKEGPKNGALRFFTKAKITFIGRRVHQIGNGFVAVNNVPSQLRLGYQLAILVNRKTIRSQTYFHGQCPSFHLKGSSVVRNFSHLNVHLP